jgi:hypothetical protein
MRVASLLVLALLALAACSSSGTTPTGSGSGGDGGGATSSSSASSSTTGTGGTGGGLPLDTPIQAPAEQWTWVPFDDAFCANGSTTGIGVNLTTKSSRVLIYLEGGGACWSDLTCNTLMTASNFAGGYGATNFTAESTSTSYLAEPGGFFDRAAAANPFKDYSYVYVPYCTGDIHAGNNVVQYGTKTAKHVGFQNMSAYLARLVPTFPSADRVILAGSSAGGYGSTYNWWQTQQAFGKIRVDNLNDSGTPMPADIAALGNGAGPTQSTQWNLPATLPPGCTGCAQSLDAMFTFYAKAFPNQRGALLSYTKDAVLPSFYGITTDQFTTGLEEEATSQLDPNPNLHYFFVDAMGHVLWFNPALTTKAVTLQQFITQMVTDDPAWASVHP